MAQEFYALAHSKSCASVASPQTTSATNRDGIPLVPIITTAAIDEIIATDYRQRYLGTDVLEQKSPQTNL